MSGEGASASEAHPVDDPFVRCSVLRQRDVELVIVLTPRDVNLDCLVALRRLHQERTDRVGDRLGLGKLHLAGIAVVETDEGRVEDSRGRGTI
jgi:hypothetical protein